MHKITSVFLPATMNPASRGPLLTPHRRHKLRRSLTSPGCVGKNSRYRVIKQDFNLKWKKANIYLFLSPNPAFSYILRYFQFAGYRAALADFATWQDRNGDSQVYFNGMNYGKQVRTRSRPYF